MNALKCSFCLGERKIGEGAMLIGIPDHIGRVQKDELCKDCYLSIIIVKNLVPIELRQKKVKVKLFDKKKLKESWKSVPKEDRQMAEEIVKEMAEEKVKKKK